MAATRGRYTTILIDGINLDGQSNNVVVGVQNGQIDVTPFQTDGRVFLVEPPQGTIQHQGYLSDLGPGSFEQETFNRLGQNVNYVSVFLNTALAACPTYVIPDTVADSLQIAAPANGVITIQGNWIAGSGSAGMQRGLRLFDGTVSGTGVQTHIDLVTPGTNGFAYLFFRQSGGAATNATVTVQSDDNTGFTSATTHGTFTISALDGYAMTITGTIDRYARVNVTSLGGASSLTFAAIIVSGGVTM